jgi:predicted aconitase with swiveling domain
MNFTAAHTKPRNLFRLSEVQDRHHELYGQDVRDRVLVIPSCIGSTYTGMVLLELMYSGASPAAIVVQEADSLLVSGAVLADIWFSRGIPIVQYGEADLFDRVHTGDWVEVNGESGEIRVGSS